MRSEIMGAAGAAPSSDLRGTGFDRGSWDASTSSASSDLFCVMIPGRCYVVVLPIGKRDYVVAYRSASGTLFGEMRTTSKSEALYFAARRVARALDRARGIHA